MYQPLASTLATSKRSLFSIVVAVTQAKQKLYIKQKSVVHVLCVTVYVSILTVHTSHSYLT